MLRNRGIKGGAGCLAALWLLLIFGPAAESVPRLLAESQSGKEVQVKLAFLARFAGFVTWPAGPAEDRLVYCALGSDAVVAEFETLSGVEAAGGKIEVRRLESTDQGRGCQVAYIAVAGQRQLKATLSELAKYQILTVGGDAAFLEAGGMINLVREENKVKFEVNLRAVQSARLALSAKLLRLAVRVLQ